MMAICPYCSADVIEGEDYCGDCQASLVDLSLPEPSTDVERALLADRVGVLNPREPLAVDESATVCDVLQTMCEERVGCVLVTRDGKLTGIFSEHDALMKIGANVEDRAEQPVSKFMTAAPQTLAVSAKVVFAVHRMDVGGFRHLPLVDDDGQPAGIVSVRDILDYLAKLT